MISNEHVQKWISVTGCCGVSDTPNIVRINNMSGSYNSQTKIKINNIVQNFQYLRSSDIKPEVSLSLSQYSKYPKSSQIASVQINYIQSLSIGFAYKRERS